MKNRNFFVILALSTAISLTGTTSEETDSAANSEANTINLKNSPASTRSIEAILAEDVEDDLNVEFSYNDLVFPHHWKARRLATEAFIRDHGGEVGGYDALTVTPDEIRSLFESSMTPIVTPGKRGRRAGRPMPVSEADRRAIALVCIFLRAPTDEVLDYFLQSAAPYLQGTSDSMNDVLFIGEPYYNFILVEDNEVIRLLVHSEAITIPMLLDALQRYDEMNFTVRMVLAHVLCERYKASGLDKVKILTLTSKNLGLENPSGAILAVVKEMTHILEGDYEYIPYPAVGSRLSKIPDEVLRRKHESP